ncbi:hypothetical protein CMK11_10795 [Candidatus Poribacteria bacterium]|nr:hypothetical protein [Candidatus Poribacteria bacterium]
MLAPLTPDQRMRYEEDGYLLVSGLIPDGMSREAARAMWRILHMDPCNPATWDDPPPGFEHAVGANRYDLYGVQDADVMACCTAAFLDATAQLLGEPAEAVHCPDAAQAFHLFPVEREWRAPAPHVDGIPRECAHRTFPGPYRLTALVYLSDVEPHGGGTMAWPGSHAKIAALAASDPEKYEYLHQLQPDIAALDLGEPVELTPSRGDVLFFRHLWAHGGTPNVSGTPRLAMRWLCSRDCCLRWSKTDAWNNWSP